MISKVLVLLALAAVVAAESVEYYEPRYDRDHYGPYDDPKYEFKYYVKDKYGNDYGHEEKREDDNTQGHYYVYLPDGRLQRVEYYVDGYSGFVAKVIYEGEARYDYDHKGSYDYKPKNEYKPPKNEYKPPKNEYKPPKNEYKPPKNEYKPPQNYYRPPYDSNESK